MKIYLRRVFVAVSQLLNVIIGGHPCETICARTEFSSHLAARMWCRLLPFHTHGTKRAARRRAKEYLEQDGKEGR